MITQPRLPVAPFALVLFVSACGLETRFEDEAPIDEAPVSTSSDALWLANNVTKWPSGVVNVCFDGFTTAERDAIRATAENSWERAAKINFTGWGSCPTLGDNTENLLVFSIKSDLGGNAGQSWHCSGASTTTCNFGGFGKAPAKDYNRIFFTSGQPATRVVIHELGHALGFIHETQSPTLCTQRTSGGVSLENEGDSENSIMVAFTSCNDATSLSSWDILGARRAYGTHSPGSVVGTNGVCLNIQGGSTTQGANIIGWACQGTPWNSVWKRNDGSLLLKATTGSTSRCLNVKGGVTSTGYTQLISWGCSESYTNEHVRLRAVEWRAMGNRCIQAEDDTAGSKIALERCTGGGLQKWDFFEQDRRIRLNGTSLCVEVPGGSTTNGTELELQTCSTSSNQVFTFANSYIKFGSKALNVRSGTTASGNRVILWPPASSSPPHHNEQFSIAGRFTMMDQCIDTEVIAAKDSTKIGVRPCGSATTQLWEYFF